MCNSIGLRIFLFVGCLPLFANAQVLEGKAWNVEPSFHGSEARFELSGAACGGEAKKKQWCLAVNDEKKTAQFFSVGDNTLKPAERIRLLPGKESGEDFDEIDAEGAAYDGGLIYVTGSHGLSRSSAKFKPSQFFVLRFPVDRTTGKPSFELTSERVAEEIERSARLRGIIQVAPFLGPFAEQPLDENGANIEGLAVVDGQMFFGFRGPSTDARAFILEISVESIFGDSEPDPIVHPLSLGNAQGIRDLAHVNEGLLVLSGHVNEENIAPRIYFWNIQSNQLEVLGEIPMIADKKAETLLVLSEKTENESTKYNMLILYDGLENGGPIEFEIWR